MVISNNIVNILLIIPAILSLIVPTIVVFTYAKFERLREYRHIEITLYVVINDLIGAFVIVFGKVSNGSALCWIQGMLTSYSFLSSVCWSAVAAYQIHIIVCRGRIIEDLTNFHRFCWGFPAVITLLPFTTNVYGQATSSWCFLGNRPGSPTDGDLVWELLSFFVWLWLAIVFTAIVFVRVFLKLHDVDSQEAMAAYRPLHRLAAIPVILVICWTLPSFLAVHRVSTGADYAGIGANTIHGFAAVLPPLQGFLIGILFFAVNRSARDEWRLFLFQNTDADKNKSDREYDMARSSSMMSSSFIATSTGPSDVYSNMHGNSRNDRFVDSSTLSSGGNNLKSESAGRGDASGRDFSESHTGSIVGIDKAATDGDDSGNRSVDGSRWVSASGRVRHSRGSRGPSTLTSGRPGTLGSASTVSIHAYLSERDTYFDRGSDGYWSRSKHSEPSLSTAILGANSNVF